MNRFFVPAVLVATISGLGFGLVVGIIARSPETHANVRPEGYDRTPVAYLEDGPSPIDLGLADPGLLTTAAGVERGRLLFFSAGCVTCHGLANQGGAVAPDLDIGELTPSDLRRAMQSGPKGMPVFPDEMFSDGDLEVIYEFLESLREEASAASAEFPHTAEEKR